MGVGLGTEPVGVPAHPSAVSRRAAQAEADGFASGWTVHFSRGVDALSTLLAAGLATTGLELGVGVVPVHPRHPAALAQQAATVGALVGGRLVLGVGVSHRPVVEGMHGLAYQRPVAYLREYLEVLVPLLEHGSATVDGAFFRVHVEITVPGSARVPVLVGALGDAMVRLAGSHGDGAVTWLAGPRALETRIGPGLRGAAAAHGRPAPRLVAALPVAVSGDVAAARSAAASVFARYAGLPNYQRLFARDGVAGPADVAVVGDERAVERSLRSLAAAGVTDLWPVVFPVDGASAARTEALLLSLARATL